jgi:hypothetical protein
MRFELGPGLTCDLEELTISRLLIQANSGGGKSWALRRLLEQTFGHIQHLVIDRDGEFVSLREKFDYVLAAKQGGDTAAHPRTAKLLARRLLELNASAILDISELDARERITFVRYFLEALVDAPKALWHPALIVVDEVEAFCPQKGDCESRDAVKGLMLLGRKRGFCGVLATKRLAALDKDAAYECNNKLIGRCLEADAKRAADELGFPGREGWQQFRKLRPGEFRSFGPALIEAQDEPVSVMVGGVQTTHPDARHRFVAATPPPASAKVRALLPKLADLPAEAEAERKSMDDLKRDLATTRRELTLAKKEQAPPDEALIERRVSVAVTQKERELRAGQQATEQRVTTLERVIGQTATELSGIAERLSKSTNGTMPKPAQKPLDAARTFAPVSIEHHVSPRERPPTQEPSGDLGSLRSGAVRILRELAVRYPLFWTKAQVGTLTGFTPSGGTFGTYMRDLKRAGFIEISGKDVRVTDAGLDAVGEIPMAPTTNAEAMEIWSDKLRSGCYKLLEAIVDAGHEGISREELAEQTSFTMTGGTFGTYVGDLRRNGLVALEGGRLIATDVVFPEGATP